VNLTYKRIVSLLFVGVTLSASSCQDSPEPLPIRSLTASGDVSYVCMSPDRTGVAMEDCPDFEKKENHLFALVTQTLTAEIAVIDVTEGEVVDVDRSSPGFTFLRVGQNPVDIVSTPGGEVSFVGVAGVGREGIFALPTTCLGPPREVSPGEFETPRDLTTWPACSLPTAPGAMAVLVDPVDEAGRTRLSCDSSEWTLDVPEPVSARRSECPVDLRREKRDPGRRKLAVTLPAFGQVVIIDAQRLLDEHEPGSFSACPIEATYDLEINLPQEPITQELPEDLQVPGCTPSSVNYPPPTGEFESQPAGIDVSEGSMFVADLGAPVIHELDVRDPCAIVERDPLLPVSLEEPTRTVTTSKVAASPTLTDGRRFLYAIDETGPSTANVMAFDLTPGQASRTPIVREGTPYLPWEPADRISFAAAAQDIVFAQRDFPIPDADTGQAVVGERCDPDPSLDLDAPGAQYRPSTSDDEGASPTNLRGTFGFVLLSSGQVGIIDVEDYDEPCRRPVYSNSSENMDFRGCANDPAEPEYYTLPDGFDAEAQPTVTAEVSCRMVQEHRARSARLAVTNSSEGTGAPSLRGFPRLTLESRALPLNNSEQGVKYPKLLAVDYPDPTDPNDPTKSLPAQTYVGTTLYSSVDIDNTLQTDPTLSERASVTLPWIEPRAYPSSETVNVVYEGTIGGERPSGFLRIATSEGDADRIDDGDSRFCDAGVQGADLARQVGDERFGLSGGALDEFATRYADYIQITQDLLPSDDEYWKSELGQSCGGGQGYFACETALGHVDDDDELHELLPGRELRIISTFQDHVLVEPRNTADEDGKWQIHMDLLDCCFPSGISYTVRPSDQWVVTGSASGFRHRVVPTQVQTDAGVSYPCAFDCAPSKRYFDGRVFETSPRSNVCNEAPKVSPNSACIYQTLTARFAVYGGSEPSERDMVFAYDVSGGFAPLTISLTRNDTSTIMPQALARVPGFRLLSAVDAQDRGLMLLSLDTLAVVSPSPFY